MLEPDSQGPASQPGGPSASGTSSPVRPGPRALHPAHSAGDRQRGGRAGSVEQYPFHEITRDFPFSTRFDSARSVTAGATKPGVTAQNLIQSSDASWATTNLTLKEPIDFKEGRDKKGPVSIAVAATLSPTGPSPSPAPSPGTEEPKKPEARVVVLGDADFVSNDASPSREPEPGLERDGSGSRRVRSHFDPPSRFEEHRLLGDRRLQYPPPGGAGELLGLPGLFVFLESPVGGGGGRDVMISPSARQPSLSSSWRASPPTPTLSTPRSPPGRKAQGEGVQLRAGQAKELRCPRRRGSNSFGEGGLAGACWHRTPRPPTARRSTLSSPRWSP